MTTTPLCIYHGGCLDGFTAAWAVQQYLGDRVDFWPATHDNPPPPANLLQGRDVIMVDFCYPAEAFASLVWACNALLVLDHHASAERMLLGVTPAIHAEIWRTRLANPRGYHAHPVQALFDMERSGAMIAWQFFHPGPSIPNLVAYVQDRDLWSFRLPHSREIHAWLAQQDQTFEGWTRISAALDTPADFERAVVVGSALLQANDRAVKEAVGQTRREMVLGGLVVPVANVPGRMASDAGHLLCSEAGVPFSATYYDTARGRRFSLRSASGFDTTTVSVIHGGGGHAAASGFLAPHGWEGDVNVY